MSASTESVELVDDETASNVARAALFAALVGAFAYVTFPLPGTTVSFTLQVLGVFLAGILLGPVWGGAAMVLYLAAGAMGAPIFEGGSAGLGVLLGGSPTVGFLWSFPIAAALIGVLVHGGFEVRDPDEVAIARLVGAMAAGTVVIYALGWVGFMLVTGVGQVEALFLAVVPFVPAELLKMAAAVAVVHSDAIRAG